MPRKHKVVVRIVERVYEDGRWGASNGREVAVFEREYPSKNAAVNNAREIGASKVFGRVRVEVRVKDFAWYEHPFRYELHVHVEDEDGNRFNHVWRSGIDPEWSDGEFDDLNPDKAFEMMRARGFARIG